MKPLIFAMAMLMLGSGAAVLVRGQQPPPNEDPPDAAEHGVARVSLVNGSVSVTRGDNGDPSGSALNAPLVTTDRISTGEGSRAEVEFDSFNVVRLAPNTDVRMGDLQYHRYLIQMMRGTTTFRVLRDSDAKIEISTPSVSVVPLRQGIYRVTVQPDGTSEITVRAGEAELLSPSGSERMPAGQTMLTRGPASDPEFMTVPAIPNDEWDRWNADRDRSFDRFNEASRYTGPDISGTEDLAANGRWVWDPSYGNVWVPNNVGPDWAPYRDGRWDYVDYYGWSWVSYDPWGWAPYHYGRWYRGNFGWAWYPGVVGPRHYWRPALVGFFGFGSPGFGASFGFGYSHVGWVPLAPNEGYRPWYGRGYSGGRNVNIVANINVVNNYRNARYENAITGLRAGDFGRTAVGRNAFVRPAAGDLSRAGMMSGGIPFAPARRSGFNTGRPSAVVPLNGGASRGNLGNDGGFNRGGWRRLDAQPGTPAGAAADAAAGARNGGGFRGFTSSPREQQPVRISPPIVNNRNQAPVNPGGAPNTGSRGNAAPRSEFGGFGGPRPNNGGGGFNAPPAPPPAQGPAPQSGGRFDGPRGGPPAGGGFRGNPGGGFNAPPAPPAQRAAPDSGGRFDGPRGGPPAGGGFRGNPGGGNPGGGGSRDGGGNRDGGGGGNRGGGGGNRGGGGHDGGRGR